MESKGEQIRGSNFYRNFCVVCKAAIRVPHYQKDDSIACDDCDHPKATDFSKGAGSGRRVIRSSKGLQ